MKINARTPKEGSGGQIVQPAQVPAQQEGAGRILSVVVPYTTPKLTAAALLHAAVFSGELKAQVRLIDVHVVPFPCPVDQPTVSRAFLENRLRELAQESAMPVRAEVVYTRDRVQGLLRSLRPASLVVMATSRRWWPTAEKRLANLLTEAGHQVVLLEC